MVAKERERHTERKNVHQSTDQPLNAVHGSGVKAGSQKQVSHMDAKKLIASYALLTLMHHQDAKLRHPH